MNSEFIGGTQAKQSCSVRAIGGGSGRVDRHLPSSAWWVTAAKEAGALGGNELAEGAEGAGEGGLGWGGSALRRTVCLPLWDPRTREFRWSRL